MDWDRIADFFNQGWLSIALALVLTIPTFYFALRKIGPRPQYQKIGQRLIANRGGLLPTEVKVEYAGDPVPRISMTYIAFWNGGDNTIRGSDIHPNYPIGFKFADGRILSVEVAKSSRVELEATTRIDSDDTSKLYLNFSFMDKNDGVLIKILHTSKSISPAYFGTIIGIPKGAIDLGPIPIPSALSRGKGVLGILARITNTPNWASIFLFSATGAIFLLSASYFTYLKQKLFAFPDSDPVLRGMFIIIGSMYIYLAIQFWYRLRRRLPRSIATYDT